VPMPPSPDASQIDAMRGLWTGAGLASVETLGIIVERTFADFEDYWEAIRGGPSVRLRIAALAPEDLALLKTRMQAHLPGNVSGRIICSAKANAIRGLVPGPL
jgi:hypothetical protein